MRVGWLVGLLACAGPDDTLDRWTYEAGPDEPTAADPLGEPTDDGTHGTTPPGAGNGPLTLEGAPRAIMGGGAAARGDLAVVADPDGGMVVVLDTVSRTYTGHVMLGEDAMPFRVALADDLAYVSLRGTGEIAAIEPFELGVQARWDVCAEPRGVAVDDDALHVACASGDLVTLDRHTGATQRRLRLPNDLRDVVVEGDGLWVSRFRSAEVLRLDADGAIVQRTRPPSLVHDPGLGAGRQPFSPSVGWRMSAAPDGGVVLLHQLGQDTPLDQVMAPNIQVYYAQDDRCSAVVLSTASRIHADRAPSSLGLFAAALPVDGYLTSDSLVVGFAAADFAEGAVQELPVASAGVDPTACANVPGIHPSEGRVVGVAPVPGGPLIVTANPFAVYLGDDLTVRQAAGDDAPWELFHTPTTASGLTCAGCHPEANDDGRVWTFEHHGPRRTQNLAVGMRDGAPYHWIGDMETMQDLLVRVFEGRMLGPEGSIEIEDGKLMVMWLDEQRVHRSDADAPADVIAEGEGLFWSAEVGCGSCHAGERLADNQTWDVGTGEPLQTPSLRGIGARGPYLHDGCADTLEARFDPRCTTDAHGVTAHLAPEQIDALVAYLHTL